MDGSSGKESSLCFPSKLLSRYTYLQELFDLKKDRLDEKPRRVNKGHCIALLCIFEQSLCFWMAAAGKNL